MKDEQKKTYTPPTLAEYGKVENETRGIGGPVWEVYGTRQSADGDPLPPPEYAG
jgi:hypothetical protein